jgi:hypothetical protein
MRPYQGLLIFFIVQQCPTREKPWFLCLIIRLIAALAGPLQEAGLFPLLV